MATQTLYGSDVANGTLTNACTMSATTGGTEASKTTTITGTNTWAEIYSQSGTFASVSSIGSPSGHGWVYSPGAGTYATGNWGFVVTLSSVSAAVNVKFRAYKYSGGTYTSIGTITKTSGFSAAKTTYTFTNTSFSSVTLGVSDLLYFDLWWFDDASSAQGDNPVVYESNSATQGVANDFVVTTSNFTPASSTRTIPSTTALLSTLTRTIASTTALQSTTTRAIPATTSLQTTLTRTITTTASLGSSRTIPSTTALLSTLTRTIATTVTLSRSRTIPATTALLSTLARTIASTTALQSTTTRTLSTTASLIFTSTRTIPSSASLYQNAVFYASNVGANIGGLTQSDQMSQIIGGAETNITVTAPGSGTTTYLELISQGGSPGTTRSLPSPTGKGWSISLDGFTILSGTWLSVFTLAKSGTSINGASLIVRWYRRTIDGIYYLIGSTTLSGQTFSTTKTIYTTSSVSASLWQFIAGDTLYMDAFAYNAGTAWSSDIFTVYVSNNATMGVYNDGIIIAPTMIATPPGLSCYISNNSLQTGTTLPILNQSFTLTDALDQRSILNATGEDVSGTLSYQRGHPVLFSDHDQGTLYTGYVNSDKISKPSAGGNTQLEHQLTMMDHHYDVDKRANVTNYLNWQAGDIVCDFIDKTLSSEGITGQFAIESDYSQASFAQGTLSGTTATTTTSPFTHTPNTASPPITTNTGSLELTRAGTQFTLTETTTSDFASGALTNMVASNNTLSPTTQSAIRVITTLPGVGCQNIIFNGTQNTTPSAVYSRLRTQFWSGSKVIGTGDFLNYDIWIASTSPAYQACVELLFSDGSTLTTQAAYTYSGSWALNPIMDQNYLPADAMYDLSGWAKDTWLTRTINLETLHGKTITAAYVYISGNVPGTYTVYVKNCYLSSASGSPFLATNASNTNVNPMIFDYNGAYHAYLSKASLEQVYLPTNSYRVSSAHSINTVGLVQNSTINWTASNPVIGPNVLQGQPGIATIPGNTLIFASYDGNTWLPCTQNQALPGLPSGTNVSSTSLYLREQFQCGQDPTAIPSLLQINITINSAANQSTTDIDSKFGTTSAWNTGNENIIGPDVNGHLTMGSISRDWNDNLITNQTFYSGNGATEAASSGKYRITCPVSASVTTTGVSKLNFAGVFSDFVLDIDINNPQPTSNAEVLIIFHGNYWDDSLNDIGYWLGISSNALRIGHGSNAAFGTLTQIEAGAGVASGNYHVKIVARGNRYMIFPNGSTTVAFDIIDGTHIMGGIGLGYNIPAGTAGSNSTATFDNLVVTSSSFVGTWTGPNTSISSLGTCGNTQICWSEVNPIGTTQSLAIVQASLDNGTTWQACQNGAVIPTAPIPGLSKGTNLSGKSLSLQVIIAGTNALNTPIIYGLEARVCGSYGTVTGTRISPVLSLSPVGYVAASNVMWNANVPTGTSVVVETTQDLSSFHTVGNSGAGEALPYWTNQPSTTQDLFNTNTITNYTNTFKSGGSLAIVAYNIPNSRITLSGGSSGLYLNNSISCTDIDIFCDLDESDTGGLVWRKVDANNFYELAIHDASSNSGFTNQMRLYKISNGNRMLLDAYVPRVFGGAIPVGGTHMATGSASNILFTRNTFHRARATMQQGLINIYWDGRCVLSYLDKSPLGAGACGLRNNGGISRYYQLWIQPLGTNLSGQTLSTKTTMTTSDPAYMPQLFVFVACIRGSSIATGASISQLHPLTTPFAVYYSTEIDTLVSASGDYYWYVDKWKQLHFMPRLALPGAFPIQSIDDPAKMSGSLLYQSQVSILSASDLYRNQQYVTDVTTLVTPSPEIKVADGNTTSWTMGYPLYSAPIITLNGQPGATVGIQGIDTGQQFYWQPGNPSISYDSTLPKLAPGIILSFTYVGQSTQNVILNNATQQSQFATLENNSGIIAEIQSATRASTKGMTSDQATTFGNGLLTRYGIPTTIDLVGTIRYPGLVPGTVIPLFLPEIMSTWNAQLPIVKVVTNATITNGKPAYFYTIDATNGANITQWSRVFYT